MIKKIWGYFLKVLAKGLEWIFNLFILIFTFLVGIVEAIKKFIIGVLTLGCFFIILTPYLLAIFFHPLVLTSVVVFIVFPLIGSILISFLEYHKYTMTEYLYDMSDHYLLGKARPKAFSSYGEKYRKDQEETQRRIYEEQERQRQEERRREEEQWSRIFEEFFRNGGYYQSSSGYQGSNYGGYQNVGPTIDTFKEKYEKSCDLLDISYDCDVYQVKLAYRKMAKKYHPDLNKDPGATEKFQEINSAFEFLTEENISRYKRLKTS